MDAFLHSLLLVTLAEMGDKTQLLAMMLAARFGKPKPIIAAITLATFLNHALSAWAGQYVSQLVGEEALRMGVGVMFVLIGLWVLVPDKDTDQLAERGGAFWTTLVVFFLAEIGDKTQLATVTLAAQYAGQLGAVIMGTTLGMLATNVPAVYFGRALLSRIPLRLVRVVAAWCFIGFGAFVLLNR
ncbi:MAG: TMEM165/GDT1 family protein [Rickettsiales bacterium]|nr:TMEM165/GDT1 family protein [Rickettsiales bacterium]